jgi:hypothetical protein
MKIEMNTIYHLPTQAHEDDFLKQADRQGLTWVSGNSASLRNYWDGEDSCILLNDNGLNHAHKKNFLIFHSAFPIIEWKIGFTKADMQVGQGFKTRNGRKYYWEEACSEKFFTDLRYSTSYFQDEIPSPNDIMEVYPIETSTVWKREEVTE